MSDTQQRQPGVPIDGRLYTIDRDLTFAERRELRDLVRESIGRTDAEIVDAFDDADIIPALVFLIRRRSDPAYTLEQALALTGEEINAMRPPDQAPQGAAPKTPRKPARAKP